MNNADYWAKRFKLMEDAIQDKAYDTYVKNLEKQYDVAIREIDTQLRAWYQRFAANNEISYSEARRWLTAAELDEFKWTVQEYIEKARESGFTGEWVKELENASARVHVSRLDAIKLQLKQHAEQLTQTKISSITDVAEFAYTQSYWHSAYEIQHGLGMGWTMQGIDKAKLEKVLSRPWTTDNQTFTARCWTDKARLVETVNQELTRMLATGAAPDKSIDAIAKLFNASKNNAGKLVMTESAYFASAAQQDCFEELEVEEYIIVGTLDKSMCDLCGGMDGRVFKMSEFKVGATAPPFHPWCRCTRAPYFADMEGVDRRFARDPDEGYTYTVPKDMTYKQWKAIQDENMLDNSGAEGYNRYRKTANTGSFSSLSEPVQMRHVDKIISEMGVDFSNIEIDIIRDEELIGRGVYGYTFPSGERIQLYPDAFSSREELVKTIGHERIHCEQIKLFGAAKGDEELHSFEKAAQFSEEYWWSEYVRRTGYGSNNRMG